MSRELEDVLHRWGAWRNREFRIPRRRSYVLGLSKPVRQWVACSCCHGLPISPICIKCRGAGGEYQQIKLVDPNSIKRTGEGGMHIVEGPPDECVLIERTLDQLGVEARAVLEARYVHYPKKYIKRVGGFVTGGMLLRVTYVNKKIAPQRINSTRYSNVLRSVKGRIRTILSL